MELKPGLTARVKLTVTDADTAQTLGSGDLPVLGSPRVLALAEAATVSIVARIESGQTTVGTRMELDHRSPTPIGHTVTAEARLTKVDGTRLTFEVQIREGKMVVAEAKIERVLVDRHDFLNKALGSAA